MSWVCCLFFFGGIRIFWFCSRHPNPPYPFSTPLHGRLRPPYGRPHLCAPTLRRFHRKGQSLLSIREDEDGYLDRGGYSYDGAQYPTQPVGAGSGDSDRPPVHPGHRRERCKLLSLLLLSRLLLLLSLLLSLLSSLLLSLKVTLPSSLLRPPAASSFRGQRSL